MATNQPSQTDLPDEISEKITNFHDSLVEVEKILATVVAQPLSKTHEKLTPIDKAKFDLVMTYSLNSLYWMYLITQGENPKDHQVKRELERIRDYMNKVKEIVDKEKRPKLDADATKRFVRGALWTPKEDNDCENPGEEDQAPLGGEVDEPLLNIKTNKRRKAKNRGSRKKLKK